MAFPIPTEFSLPKRELVYCQHCSDVTERSLMPVGRRAIARASGGKELRDRGLQSLGFGGVGVRAFKHNFTYT